MKSKKYSIKEKQALCAKRRLELVDNATKAEIAFMARLENLGIRYMFQKGFIAGNGFCIVDFYLPKPNKLVIEIDGKYHNDPIQQYKDKKRSDYLTIQRKLRVVRITNEEVFNLSDEDLLFRLALRDHGYSTSEF